MPVRKLKASPLRVYIIRVVVLATICLLIFAAQYWFNQKVINHEPQGERPFPTSTTENRPLLVRNEKGEYPNLFATLNCGPSLNSDEPDRFIDYTNLSYGITKLQLPLSNSWGAPKYRLQDYEEVNTSTGLRLYFGPLINFECGWGRAFYIDVIPGRSIQRIKTDLAKLQQTAAQTISISSKGYQVFRYAGEVDVAYGCDMSFTEVVGNHWNYQFHVPCYTLWTPNQSVIDGLIDSIELSQ